MKKTNRNRNRNEITNSTIVLSTLLMIGNTILPASAQQSAVEDQASPPLSQTESTTTTQTTEATDQPKLKLAEAVSTTDLSSAHQLEEITKRIARKENELILLNTRFRSECTRTSKWKPWRMFAYNLGASGCSEAGITEISATRWHYWTRPKTMPRSTGKAGPILLLIGHCITLGGVATESTLDLINDYKVKKKGLDIKTTHGKVLNIKADIDGLISQREDILSRASDLTQAELSLAKAEGTVLSDVRDLSLTEYRQFHVRARKYFANRNTNSAMTTLAATTGGFQGSLLGIISAEKRRPKLTGPGGLGFVISGASIMATPPITKLAATIAGNRASKEMNDELGALPTTSVTKLDSDINSLSTLASSNVSNFNSDASLSTAANIERRLSAYNKEKVLFTAQNEMNAREKSLADREFLERMFFATCIGGSKMSWGINLANAGFSYRTQIKFQPAVGKTPAKWIADPGPGKVFTKRVAIGATTYIPGTSLWLFDTFQNRIRGLARDQALAKQSKLPAALLKERMDRVNEIDSSFNY